MSRYPELSPWIATVLKHFPGLSKPLAVGLAWWSLGMILARSCALSAVAGLLAPLLGQSFLTVRERLRDTYREASAKAGTHRAELDMGECWAPWLAWVLEGWSGQQVAIAFDATTLGQRFVALVISALSWLCRPGRLEDSARNEEASVAARMAGLTEALQRSCAARLDRHCPGRSRLVRQMAFSGDSGAGLVPAAAHQSTGHVSTSRLVSLGTLDPTGTDCGSVLCEPRHRLPLQGGATGVHVAGPLGRRS